MRDSGSVRGCKWYQVPLKEEPGVTLRTDRIVRKGRGKKRTGPREMKDVLGQPKSPDSDPAHTGMFPVLSLSITNSRNLLKLMSIESVMPSNPLILCCPLLLPSIFPSTRVYLLSRVQNQDWLVETGPEKRKCRLQCHVTT